MSRLSHYLWFMNMPSAMKSAGGKLSKVPMYMSRTLSDWLTPSAVECPVAMIGKSKPVSYLLATAI